MKTLSGLLLLFALLCIHNASCQEWKWAQSWGPSIGLQEMTIDGADNLIGCFIGQEVDFGDTTFAIAGTSIAKFDRDGNLAWARYLGDVSPVDITADPNGNILLTGSFNGTLILDTTVIATMGTNDCFVVKLDPSGNLMWGKLGVGSIVVFPRQIKTDKNGNVIVYGDFRGQAVFDSKTLTAPSLGFNMFIVKYDAFGNPLWAESMGSPSSNYAGLLKLTDANDIIVSGIFYDSLKIGSQTVYKTKGNSASFIAMFSAFGSGQWVQSVSSESFLYIPWCKENTNGELYFAGSFSTLAYFGNDTLGSGHPSSRYFFVSKLDQAHNPVWTKVFKGGTYVACLGGESLPNGDFLFGLTYRDTLFFDKDTMISGDGFDRPSVAKLTGTGDLIWFAQMEPTSFVYGYFATNSQGEAYIGTTFSDTMMVGNYVFTSGSNNIQNAVIAKVGDKSVGFSSKLTNNDGFNVYPNPSNGLFRIELDNESEVLIWVYDIMGKLVYRDMQYDRVNSTIDLREQGSGIYVIRVGGEQKNRTGRIIISR